MQNTLYINCTGQNCPITNIVHIQEKNGSKSDIAICQWN